MGKKCGDLCYGPEDATRRVQSVRRFLTVHFNGPLRVLLQDGCLFSVALDKFDLLGPVKLLVEPALECQGQQDINGFSVTGK